MAAKKRRSKDFIRRSKASKKGWVSRKKKQALAKKLSDAQQKLRNAQLGVKKKKRVKIKRLPAKKKLTISELQEIIASKDRQIAILELTKDWVNAMPDEYLHKDGTLALKPSRARHMGRITDEIMKGLRKAKKKGENAFDRAARFYAGYFGLAVREIYTLWHSP